MSSTPSARTASAVCLLYAPDLSFGQQILVTVANQCVRLYKAVMTLNPPQSRAGRALLGWSQTDLADRSNVSLSTIRDFETGRRTPMVNNLAAMRRALEEAGVVLFNDGAPGARLMPRSEAA